MHKINESATFISHVIQLWIPFSTWTSLNFMDNWSS